MIRYVIKRILWIIPTVLGVILLLSAINYISPGSPAESMLGAQATPEAVAELEKEMGLDRPFFVQYADYVWTLITTGSLGNSYVYKMPVWKMILPRIWPTAVITLCSAFLSTVIAIPLGILSATRHRTIFDYSGTLFCIIFKSIPNFWLALLLLSLFAVKLRWVPASGYSTPAHFILPIFSTTMASLAGTMRMTRSSMLEVVRQDYIRTAKSKGLSPRDVTYRHALKNALIPVVTMIGIYVGMSLAGSVIVETIFAIPGLGTTMVKAINQNDYIVTQGIVTVCGTFLTIVTLITDLIYAFLDPRIMAQYKGSNKVRPKKQRAAGKLAGAGST